MNVPAAAAPKPRDFLLLLNPTSGGIQFPVVVCHLVESGRSDSYGKWSLFSEKCQFGVDFSNITEAARSNQIAEIP